MKYKAFLETRGAHFKRVVAKCGDGVICTTTFGGINLTRHVMGLAESRLDRELVNDIGGYGVMHDRCEIDPLVEFMWKAQYGSELRVMIHYVKDSSGRVFICVQRGSHNWFAIARTNRPNDAMLIREFFASRRRHDKQGFGFCRSQGVPKCINNYRPDLLDRQTVVDIYGHWLRWAEKLSGHQAFHYGAFEGDVVHGVGRRDPEIQSFKRSVEAVIRDRPLTKTVILAYGDMVKAPRQKEEPPRVLIPRGLSPVEAEQYFRDGYESVSRMRLRALCEAGKLEAARDLAEKIIVVVRGKPASLATLYGELGVIHERLREYENAADAYRQLIALEPTDRREWYYAFNNLGFCLNQLARHQEAEVQCRQAIAIEPGWYNAYKNLGVALAGQGDYAGAAEMFVQATILGSFDRRALDHLEDLIEDHDVVKIQIPDIERDLDTCRDLVKNRGRGYEGLYQIRTPSVPNSPDEQGEMKQKKGKTIVLLDDDPELVHHLGGELVHEGFDVFACACKRIFLAESQKINVNLVISDIESPLMNGIHFIDSWRRNERTKQIPVIIVSAAEGSLCVTAVMRGARKVFPKPYRFEELLSEVNEALFAADNTGSQERHEELPG